MSFTKSLEVLDRLRDGGMERVEIYSKEGRGRTCRLFGASHQAHFFEEQGWAVRAGDSRCSFFAAGVGEPSPDARWPTADGYPLHLASSGDDPGGWAEPEDFRTPLMGEIEARELVAGVARTLSQELPEARVEVAVLDEGSSESRLVSSEGIEAFWRHRLSFLRLEASWRGARVELERSERAARRFHPVALAQQLADRLLVLEEGRPCAKDRAPLVLAPAVGAKVLDSLRPLWVGGRKHVQGQSYLDRSGRLASDALVLVDNGRHSEGLLTAPVDGEGRANGRTVIVEGGQLKQPLIDWRDEGGKPSTGWYRRSGWRDLPVLATSHLFVEPTAEQAVGDLIGGVSRGYYIVEVPRPIRIDWSSGRISIPACGFALEAGQAKAPVAQIWLTGTIGSLLRGVQRTGRDLSFFPLDGMVGCPTLLVQGLEVRDSPG